MWERTVDRQTSLDLASFPICQSFLVPLTVLGLARWAKAIQLPWSTLAGLFLLTVSQELVHQATGCRYSPHPTGTPFNLFLSSSISVAVNLIHCSARMFPWRRPVLSKG